MRDKKLNRKSAKNPRKFAKDSRATLAQGFYFALFAIILACFAVKSSSPESPRCRFFIVLLAYPETKGVSLEKILKELSVA